LRGWFEVGRSKRTVVEIRDELHREIRKLALLNDLRIYQVANGIIEEFLKDREKARVLLLFAFLWIDKACRK